MGKVTKYIPLSERKSAIDMRQSDALEELHSVLKLIRDDQMRVLAAINAELEIYNRMADRAETQNAVDAIRLKQARAAQKPSIDPRMIEAINKTIQQMREIAGETGNVAEITFINDFESSNRTSNRQPPIALDQDKT